MNISLTCSYPMNPYQRHAQPFPFTLPKTKARIHINLLPLPSFISQPHLLPPISHRSVLLPHFPFGGSNISNFIFGCAFSTSLSFLPNGLPPSYSEILVILAAFLGFWTSFGKVVRLGVRAVATRRAEERSFLRTSQERFLARYQRMEDATWWY